MFGAVGMFEVVQGEWHGIGLRWDWSTKDALFRDGRPADSLEGVGHATRRLNLARGSVAQVFGEHAVDFGVGAQGDRAREFGYQLEEEWG